MSQDWLEVGAKVLANRAAQKRYKERDRERFNSYRRKQHAAKQERRATRARPAVCEICASECQTGRQLAWDHNHATGQFRGWLCYTCNVGLGSFLDNPETLRKAAAYLEQNS